MHPDLCACIIVLLKVMSLHIEMLLALWYVPTNLGTSNSSVTYQTSDGMWEKTKVERVSTYQDISNIMAAVPQKYPLDQFGVESLTSSFSTSNSQPLLVPQFLYIPFHRKISDIFLNFAERIPIFLILLVRSPKNGKMKCNKYSISRKFSQHSCNYL